MADKITSIYEKACNKGILDPKTQSEEWFRNQISTESGMKSFYDHATANGMKFHPYPEFKERLMQPAAPSTTGTRDTYGTDTRYKNPSVKDNPAPTTEEEYQDSIERQDLATGARKPITQEDKAELQQDIMLQQAEQMRRNAQQIAQGASQSSMPEPSLSINKPDGSVASAAKRVQEERFPDIRKHTIAQNMLNETAEELNPLLAADREQWMSQGANMGPVQRTQHAADYHMDPYLAAANSLLFESKVRMEDTKRQNGVSWRNVGEGALSFAKDTGKHLLTKFEGMASFGLSDLRNAKLQRDVLKKVAAADAFDNPESVLSPNEKALYDATITNIAVEIAREKDTSRWSKAGQITADMIPFVEDIMVGNALFKGIGDAGRKAIAKGVEKHVRNKLAKWITTNVSDVAISGLESAATAAILPHTYAETLQNTAKADMSKVALDGDYRMKLGGINEQGLGKSWAQAYGNQVKELFTETGGNFRLIGRALVDNPLGKAILKTPFGMVLKRFEAAQGGIGSRFASMTMYHGVVGEWLEELEGAIYDGNLKDFFSADTQLPMLLSFSVPAAFTGGLNAAQQAALKAKYAKAGNTIDKLIGTAPSFSGLEKNKLKAQIMSSLYQTNVEDIPSTIGAIVERVYPEEYNSLMEGAPEKGNKAAELAYALKEYLASGTALTAFDPDMLGSQVALVQEQRQQMRQQAAMQAQAEVQRIAHEDGNIYNVGIKGRDDMAGYAMSGQLNIEQDEDGNLKAVGRDLVAIKMLDRSVRQLPADEVSILGTPENAQERVQAITDHLLAKQANNELFQIGDKVYLKQGNQLVTPDSSTITNIDDAGVHVETMDEQGNPQEMVIPHEQAAETLAAAPGETEDGIVSYSFPDGSELRLRQVGEGVYETIAPDESGRKQIFTEEDLQDAGATHTNQQQEEEQPAQPAETPETGTTEQAPAYPVDEFGNPAWSQIDQAQATNILYDLFQGNKGAAQAYADDAFKEAEKVQRAAAKKQSHSLNIAQRLEEDAAFKAEKDAANAAVAYWQNVKLSLNQIKTAEEQAADEAQRQAMMQARTERSKTEEGVAAGTNMAERFNAAPKIDGNAGTITLPDGRELAGHYILISPDGLTTSHNALDGYKRSEGYPVTSDGQSINDRDYTNDPEEQQKVESVAQNFNGNAIKNMPVISDEGLVYDGNGRMMAGQLAAINNTDAAYLNSLAANATQYGFSPEQVESIPHARVVFQLDERLPYSTQSLAIFNEQETQTQSNTGKAAGYARKLTPQAISEVLAAVDGFNTIDAFFSDKKAPFDLINKLINTGIIAQREKAEMLDGNKLSATGRERLSNILFGTVFDNETIRLMGDDAALKNSILRALPQILDNKSLGEYSLENDINDAIRLLYQVRNADVPFRSFVSQTVIAEDGQVHTAAEGYSPYQLLLAEEMAEGGVDAFRDVLTSYNDEAHNVQGGQVDIFSNLMTPAELKNLILQSYGKEPNEQERQSASRQTDNAPESAQPGNEQTAEEAAEQVETADQITLTDGRIVTPATITYRDFQLLPDNLTPIQICLIGTKANMIQSPELHVGTGFNNIARGVIFESLEKYFNNLNKLREIYFASQKEYVYEPNKTEAFKIAAGEALREIHRIIVDLNPKDYDYGRTGSALVERLTDAELAVAEAETDTNPTEAQKKAENYKQGHVTLWGLPITIENPKGSIRRGTDANGKKWEQKMNNTYGKIRRTEGVDGDHIDVFIGPNLHSDKVFVVDQLNVATGEFDEHKVMLGFDSLEHAQSSYLSNYKKGWKGMGDVTEVTMDEFKKWIESSHRKTKPFNEYKSIKKEEPKKPLSLEQVGALEEAFSLYDTGADTSVYNLLRSVKEIAADNAEVVDVVDEINSQLDSEGLADIDMAADAAEELRRRLQTIILRDRGIDYADVFNPNAGEDEQSNTPSNVTASPEQSYSKAIAMPKNAENAKNEQKNEKSEQNILINQNNSVSLQPNEKQYTADGLSVVVNISDYNTYLTPDAKEVFSKLAVEKNKNYAYPSLAFVQRAAWDGVDIPVDILKELPEVKEAEQRLASHGSDPLVIDEQQTSDLADRLLDNEHGSAVLNDKGKISKKNGVEDFSGEVKRDKKAFIIIGRPAAGKSSVFANPLSGTQKARIIDSDIVKPWLEGFDDGYGAGYVQDASSKVMERALWKAVERGENIVIPKIGGASIIEQMVLPLKRAGYSVELYFNEVEPESSFMRAMARFAEEGRYLSLGYLQSIKDKPLKTFRNYADLTIQEYEYNKEHNLIDESPADSQSTLSQLLVRQRGGASSAPNNRGGQAELPGVAEHRQGELESKQGGSGVSGRLFDYAEWKNNDVEFGQQPKLIWKSDRKTPTTPQGPKQSKKTTTTKSSEFGSKNKIVTTSEAQDLAAQLKDLLNETKNLGVIADPMRDAERSAKIMTIGTRLAMYYIEGGAHKFADFCQKMIEHIGDAIRPYLKSLYMAARYNPEMTAYAAQMDGQSVVDDFDVNNVNINTEEEEQPAEDQPSADELNLFNNIKEEYPGATLIFRVGDFYEAYNKDAEEISKILGITLTHSNKFGPHTPMAGFKFYDLDKYLPMLVRAGKRVAICDQLEDPKKAKGLVKRGVTESVIPGEPYQEQAPEATEPEQTEQQPTQVVTDTIGEITESKHTKTGATIYIVKPLERVGNDEFKTLKRRAKDNNGYYSSFVKGFVFNSIEEATRFNNISDEQTTTEQTSADTEAVISTAEATAATAEAIETPEQVAPEVTPEAKEEQVTEVQQVIEQVDDAVEQINKQLAILGYYEADEADNAFHEFYGYMKSAEAKALKDIDRLAKQLAADLGIEVDKRKKLATANIPPAGGEVTFRLPLIDGLELYMCVSLSPNTGDYFKANGKRDDLAASSMFWRIEDPTKGGMARYKTGNVYEATLGSKIVDVTYEELLNNIKRIAKDYLPKVEETSAPVEHISDLLEEAKKRKAASDKRKKDKTRIPDGQQVLSLFDDAVEDLTEAAREEEQLNDNNNGNTNENTEGTGRTAPEGSDEVGSNGTESDGGQQTGTAKEPSRGRNTRNVAEPDAGQNGGETQQSSSTGTEQPRSKRGGASGTTGGVSSDNVVEDPTVEHGDYRADDGSLRSPKEKDTPKNTRNYLYPEDAGEIDNMSSMERLETNVEALEVLRTLLTEDREATPEERATLGKLRGWGGINVPDNYTVKYNQLAMNPLQKRLVEVINALDPNEDRKLLDSLRTASLTSYYTPIPIARAMHAIAEQAGYKGNGNMLDPSMGNGVFEGSMAKGVQQSTNIRGVELDWLTGQIAQKLYPDARINITGFQDAHIPQDYYDYVVSNIPFGSLQITDLDWQKNPSPIRKAAQGKIHNYFAVKMIESTRPGGLCVIMTSNAIMDTAGNDIIRKYITDNCEVLGAVRLPNNTFKGAGTRVVTDVIYLRKYRNAEERIQMLERADYWEDIATPFNYTEPQALEDKNGATHQVRYSKYYQQHPENIIGTPVAGGQYSDEAYDQESNLSTDELAQQLETIGRRFMDERKKRFGNITVNTTTPRAEIQERIKERYKGNGRYESSGNIVVQDGKIGKLEGAKEGNVTQLMFTEQKLGSATVAQVTDYANLRSHLKQLIHVQIENYTSDRIDEVRKQMQQAYTAYTKKYGKLCEKKNAFIEEDIDGYQVRALEQWKDGKFVGMADIYTKNTIASERNMNDVSDPQTAVLNSLAEYGNINTEYLQHVLGDNFAEACKGLIFEDPSHQGEYIARDVYLSGDVVTKLEYARQMAEEDSRFQENVTALEAIQPKRKEFGEFPCHMGARWIPVQIYNDFLNEIFGIRGNWKGQKTGITYVEATNEYIFNFVPSEFGGNAAKYATRRKSAQDIFQAALLDKDITVKYKDEDGKEHTDQEATDAARDKVAELREAFDDWVPQKPERVQQLTDTYNSVFNRHVLPTYNGQHLNIVGLQGMKLRPHQKDAVWRIINQRGGIVDHIVGAGKSLVMQASIMEMRRMGIAKKPMILALKSTTQQIANEFRQAFPAARVLAPTEADFSTQNRKRFLAQIAVNDYDCIILSHEQYTALDHTEAIKRSFIEDQIAQLDNLLEYLYGQKDESQLTKKQIKGLEKRKENLKERLKKLELIRTDEEFVFENLGVDYLFVDECQAFKNLMFQTSYSQIAGLGNPEGSERSTKLLYGVRALQEMHQGDMGTVFLSGTTITNSLSELYNIFNYLRPNEMARMGLNTFDAWASTFAVRSTEAEFGTTNELKEKSRFRKFEGLQELSRLYTEIADVRNDNNLELPKPKLHTVFVKIPISETMKKINDAIVKLVREHDLTFFNFPRPEREDKYPWSLIATNLAKLATLSPKLIDPSYDDENGKIFHVCENIKKIYDQFNDQKGVQLVFCDTGVPDPSKKYDAYTDIIHRLTKDYGIPRSEIADIHEAGNDEKRQALFKKVNEGKVRIIIGGTKNMGTGVNVQQRVVAMHHLDIPWTPADVNQRNGRGSRQGNEIARDYNNNQVDAYYYAVERTLDTYRYQLQDVKGKMIDSFKMANVGVNEFDEGGGDDNMSPAEMVATLSGNPVILDKAKQDKLVDKLKRLQRSSVTEYARRKGEYEMLQQSQSTMQGLIRRNAEDIETLKRNGYGPDAEGNWPTLHPVLSEYERVSSGDTFEKPSELGEAIHARIKETGTAYLYAAGISAKVVPYVDANGETKLGEYELQANTNSGVRYMVKLSDDDTAAGQAMQNLLRKIHNNAEVYKHRLEELNNKLEGADPGEYSFTRQAELDEALAKKREIDAEYNKLIVSDKKPKPTEEKPEMQLLNLDYDAELTDEQQLATDAVIEALNDNTDLEVILATEEEAAALIGDDNVEFNMEFNNFLDRFKKQSLSRGESWRTRLSAGMLKYLKNGKQLLLDQSVLTKAKKKHNINIDSLRDLPEKLSSPIAVFKTARTDVDAKVVLIEAKDDMGNNIVVAINMESTHNGIEVNEISSIYGRENFMDFVRWTDKGLLEDGDIEKFKAWYASLPEYNSQGESKTALEKIGAKLQQISQSTKFSDKKSENNGDFAELSIKANHNSPYLFKKADGTLYGWAIGDRIYLTQAGINPNTPIHEYTHLWAKAMQKNNREGWQSIVDIFKDTSMWDEVVNDKNYSGLTTDDAICSEAIARYSGSRGAARMEEAAAELLHEAGQSGSAEQIGRATQLIRRVRKALSDFWKWVGTNLFGIKNFTSAEEVADRVLFDMLSGTELDLNADQEMQHLKERAMADGTFMQAPNGKRTNLTERQWLQVRTRAFKRWFGDWENDPQNASKMLDKNGEPLVTYHGTRSDFYTFDDSFRGTNSGDNGFFGRGHYFTFGNGRLSRDEASYYGGRIIDAFLNLRNPFLFKENIFADYKPENGKVDTLGGNTGESLSIINYVRLFPELVKDIRMDHVDSDMEIDREITLAEYAKIFEETYNTKKFVIQRNVDPRDSHIIRICADPVERTSEYTGYKWTEYAFEYDMYEPKEGEDAQFAYTHYYLTERSEHSGDEAHEFYLLPRYEKIHRVTEDEEFTEAVKAMGHDGVLQSEAGDEAVVFDSNQIKSATGNNGEFSQEDDNIERSFSKWSPEQMKTISDWNIAHPRPQYMNGETLESYEKRLFEWEDQRDRFRKQLQAGTYSAPTAEPVPAEPVKEERKPKKTEAPAFVPGVRPTPEDGETPYEFATRLRAYYDLMRDAGLVEEYTAEINNQADATSKLLKKNTLVRALFDAAKPIENFQDWMIARGAKMTDESNAYTDTFLATGRVTNATDHMMRNIIRPLARQIAKIIAPDEKTGKGRLDDIHISWHNMDVPGTGTSLNGKQLTPREIVGVYCQAKDCAEAIDKGLPDRGAAGFRNNLGVSHEDIIKMVESAISRKELDELWRLINAATHFALNYDFESGRISEDTHTQFYQREFYVPQRGWRERDESGLVSEYEPVGKRGNDPYNAALVKARGRQSLASDPFAYIMSIDASSIVSSENNKIKQKFLQFCLDNENIGLKTGAFRVKKYWIMNVLDEKGNVKLDADGNPMMEVSYTAPTSEDIEHDREIRDIIRQKRKELTKVNRAYMERSARGELGPQLDAAYKAKVAQIEKTIEDMEKRMRVAWHATNTHITQRTSDEKKQHEVHVVREGQEYVIELQDEKLANAINKKFKQHQEELFNTSSRMRNATRFMSAVLTQFNPEFAASNFSRDYQVAVATLAAEHPELLKPFIKNFKAIQPAVWEYAFNDKVLDQEKFQNSELGDYLREYFRAGAATGFSYMQDLKTLRNDFDAMVNESDFRKGMKAAVGVFSMLTEVSETAVRFAGYVSARQAGIGVNDAAYLSKELTTNFDRAGEVADSGWMSWFSFFRATLNGNIKFFRAFKKMPLAYSIVAASYMAMGMLNQFLNPDDPDDEIWASDYTRQSNFVLGKIRIPTAHFMRMYFAAGVNAAKWLQNNKSFGEATYNTATFATQELLPNYLNVLGNGTEWDNRKGRPVFTWEGLLQGVMPSPISPVADVYFNRDFRGATINREPFTKAQEGTKDILTSKEHTLPIYKWLTQTIYEGVGGDMNTRYKSSDPAWRSWLFDVSASSVEHVVEGYMPAGVDMLATISEAIYDAATGTPTGPDKWPFVRKFYNAYTPERAYIQQYSLLNGRLQEFKRNLDDYQKNDKDRYRLVRNSQEYKTYLDTKRLIDNKKTNPTTEDVKELLNANKLWLEK